MIVYRDPGARTDAKLVRVRFRRSEWLQVITDDITASAFDYLESRGKKYLVDFGVQNAIDKATDALLARLAA